jgi:hypothetical protein
VKKDSIPWSSYSSHFEGPERQEIRETGCWVVDWIELAGGRALGLAMFNVVVLISEYQRVGIRPS